MRGICPLFDAFCMMHFCVVSCYCFIVCIGLRDSFVITVRLSRCATSSQQALCGAPALAAVRAPQVMLVICLIFGEGCRVSEFHTEDS